MINFSRLIFLLIIMSSCQSLGLLDIKGSINNSLREVSAAELDLNNNIIWTIEDSGNKNNLIGLNEDGSILKSINIINAKNKDWEDLTSDSNGNIYIGDFGNNNRKRTKFRIYKIKNEDLTKDDISAERIDFTLPNKKAIKDFEAFFVFNNTFYIFSKEHKKFEVITVPNEVGKHEAIVKYQHNLEGKNNRITSADISNDGKTVVLLNHDKLWKLTDFKTDDFFSGTIKAVPFKHNSQKEGICFKTSAVVIITDERTGADGGNIYNFSL